MMLAALLLAAAEPAPVPGLQTLVRQDCTADCSFEAVVKTGRFTAGEAPPILSGDGEAVCLLNPIITIAKARGSDTPMAGVLTSVTLTRDGAERQVPVFLTFDVTVTKRVMVGQLCGARLGDNSFAGGWAAADPVRIPPGGSSAAEQERGDASSVLGGLLAGVGSVNTGKNQPLQRASSNGRTTVKTGAARGYDSFSLRGAAIALEQAYAGMKKALPSGSDLSPSQWLFKRDSAATLQLLLRSVPKGARVLLGTTDIGLATETPIAVDRASFDAIVLASGKVRRPIKACKVTPLTSATADALVECDLKGQ